jgi:hypothetical protein
VAWKDWYKDAYPGSEPSRSSPKTDNLAKKWFQSAADQSNSSSVAFLTGRRIAQMSKRYALCPRNSLLVLHHMERQAMDLLMVEMVLIGKNPLERSTSYMKFLNMVIRGLLSVM